VWALSVFFGRLPLATVSPHLLLRVCVVPTHVFPPGRWEESKTSRGRKRKLTNLHTASVGEVVFTDTFDSGDSKYKYGQIYYDYVSGWGDVFPIRSRTEVGNSLADFAAVTGSHYALSVITLARTWVEKLMRLRVVSVYNERTSVLATPCKIMQKGTWAALLRWRHSQWYMRALPSSCGSTQSEQQYALTTSLPNITKSRTCGRRHITWSTVKLLQTARS
jgi:hypothetical protein